MTVHQLSETMSKPDLSQLQIERLQTTLNRVYRNVSFYKHALDEHKIQIDTIRNLADIRNLPLTSKEDLRKSYPYDMFALPLRDVVRIHASSGTTGKPIVVGYSRNDLAHWADLVARELSWAGITDRDVVQIGFAYGLFTGGLGYQDGAEKIGASVIPASNQTAMSDLFTIMKDFKTSALICSPTTALTLARYMRSTGIHPEQLHMKRGIIGSEPWSESVRTEIEETFQIELFDSYGLSEIMGPGVSAECECHCGLHVNEDHFIVEVIDPKTLESLDEGDEGELVFTTITKEAFPLIRYRTGDRGSIIPGPCKCGRTFVRTSRITGRTDDLIMLQGAKVFPLQLLNTVHETKGIAPQCQIIISKTDGADAIEIRVAIESNYEHIDEIKILEKLRTDLGKSVKDRFGIGAKITFMEETTLINENRGKKQPVVIDKRYS